MEHNPHLARRDFLKLSGIAATFLAIPDLSRWNSGWPGDVKVDTLHGRVARNSIYLYEKPDLYSRKLDKIRRDTILDILEEIRSLSGPAENPRWYRLKSGFVHSAYIQRLDGIHVNSALEAVSEAGQLGEITVPYTQSYWKNRQGDWILLYRLYFHSVHWLTGLTHTSDGKPWYLLVDEWLRVLCRVQAEHVRPISPSEIAPISPDVHPNRKLIKVSLSRQQLSAYESNRAIFQATISTGKRYMETPKGEFTINRKHASKHMGDGGLTSSLDAYELPGVPWTSFFHPSGIAFHGAYWHDNFGVPMSQGCVNMRPADALWLFRWSTPAYSMDITDRSQWKQIGDGTKVIIE
jgi:hypothetical protein